MVQFKAGKELNNQLVQDCFNSKMVQFKVRIIYVLACTVKEFQFQNGAIQSLHKRTQSRILTTFQFQNGAIQRPTAKIDNLLITSKLINQN
ncbi:MAG: hypothetical protein AAF806_04820 [Bacteroidota bacterium]